MATTVARTTYFLVRVRSPTVWLTLGLLISNIPLNWYTVMALSTARIYSLLQFYMFCTDTYYSKRKRNIILKKDLFVFNLLIIVPDIG